MTENAITTVCVYSGSSQRVGEGFKSAARDLGHLIANQGWRLVYGGITPGMMGIVADAVLERGGHVTGIVPERLRDYPEIQHARLSALETVTSMAVRKQRMAELADAFIVLPGGLGTLEEVFENLVWKQIGLHDKPLILVNVDGFWDGLLATLKTMAGQNFMREDDLSLFLIAPSVSDIPALLAGAPRVKGDPRSKWF